MKTRLLALVTSLALTAYAVEAGDPRSTRPSSDDDPARIYGSGISPADIRSVRFAEGLRARLEPHPTAERWGLGFAEITNDTSENLDPRLIRDRIVTLVNRDAAAVTDTYPLEAGDLRRVERADRVADDPGAPVPPPTVSYPDFVLSGSVPGQERDRSAGLAIRAKLQTCANKDRTVYLLDSGTTHLVAGDLDTARERFRADPREPDVLETGVGVPWPGWM